MALETSRVRSLKERNNSRKPKKKFDNKDSKTTFIWGSYMKREEVKTGCIVPVIGYDKDAGKHVTNPKWFKESGLTLRTVFQHSGVGKNNQQSCLCMQNYKVDASECPCCEKDHDLKEKPIFYFIPMHKVEKPSKQDPNVMVKAWEPSDRPFSLIMPPTFYELYTTVVESEHYNQNDDYKNMPIWEINKYKDGEYTKYAVNQLPNTSFDLTALKYVGYDKDARVLIVPRSAEEAKKLVADGLMLFQGEQGVLESFSLSPIYGHAGKAKAFKQCKLAVNGLDIWER